VTVDSFAAAEAAASVLRERTGYDSHDVAVVLGSGFSPAAEALGAATAEIPVTDLGGFPAPTVAGHAGTVRCVEIGRRRVLVFLGRVHLYEGHPPGTVVHGVRTAIAAGCSTIVLTNAAGGLRTDYVLGQPVLIRDHLNLTATSPLVGPPPPPEHPRFVDLSDLYSARLRRLARAGDPSLAEGVYAALIGPHYETPAEVAMLRILGADLVGMSTALEAIAARQLGAEVLGLSLVTNVAAGTDGAAVSHEDVIAQGARAAGAAGSLIADVIGRLT
jgi:purine-nucleoside phosphorylase